MKAARVHAYGPPDNLVVEDVPDPVPSPTEVVIRPVATGLNFTDLLILADKYQVSRPLPLTPGSEFSGLVVAVGTEVTRFATGDRVFGTVPFGACAELVPVAADRLFPLPQSVSFAEAAAFPIAFTTSYFALRSIGDAKPGDWVVILGAAGGIGLAAVQLAAALGCRVLAAASSGRKLQACSKQGAEAVIDYSSENLKERIREITGGGADVIVDPVGGPYAEEALRAARWGGRFVSVGFASGEIPRIPLNLVLIKGVIVRGFELRTFFDHAPGLAAHHRRELHELLAQGRCHPQIAASYPLSETAGALRFLADRQAIGKVMIEHG